MSTFEVFELELKSTWCRSDRMASLVFKALNHPGVTKECFIMSVVRRCGRLSIATLVRLAWFSSKVIMLGHLSSKSRNIASESVAFFQLTRAVRKKADCFFFFFFFFLNLCQSNTYSRLAIKIFSPRRFWVKITGKSILQSQYRQVEKS